MKSIFIVKGNKEDISRFIDFKRIDSWNNCSWLVVLCKCMLLLFWNIF